MEANRLARVKEAVGLSLAASSLVLAAACNSNNGEHIATDQAQPPTGISQTHTPGSHESGHSSTTRSPENTPAVGTSSGKAAETSASECIPSLIPVKSGSGLKESNLGDVQDQIGALAVAYDPNRSVTADNLVDATALLFHAERDPSYADAFAHEQQLIADGKNPVSAEQLYAMRSQFSGPDCMTEKQHEEAVGLYQAITKSYGPKIGEQAKAATSVSAKLVAKGLQAAYAKLKAGWDEFDRQYHQELGR